MPALKAAVPAIVKFFFEVIKDEYDLFVSLDDDQEEPVEASKIQLLSEIASSAAIWTESNDWIEIGENRWSGHSADKY